MKTQPIQDSFLGGAIGESARGQTTSPLYKKGLRSADDYYITPQGGLVKRCGSRFRYKVPGQQNVRIFTFPNGLDRDFVVEVGDSKVRVYDGYNGQARQSISSTGNFERFTDPYFLSGYAYWDWVIYDHVGVDHDPSTLFNDPPEVKVGGPLLYSWWVLRDRDFSSVYEQNRMLFNSRIKQKIIIPGGESANNFKLSVDTSIFIDNKKSEPRFNGEMYVPDPFSRPDWWFPGQNADTLSHGVFTIRVGTTPGASDIALYTYNTTNMITLTAQAKNHSIQFVPGTAVFYVELDFKMVYTFQYWQFKQAWVGCQLNNLKLTVTNYSDITNAPVEFNSPYSLLQLKDIQYDHDVAQGWMVFWHPNVEPRALIFNGGVWTFSTFIAVPPIGAPWSGTNWPCCGCFHDSRIWMAGDPAHSSTLYASVVGNYADMGTIHAPVIDSDALQFKLATVTNIRWLQVAKEIVIGCDAQEIVSGSQGGVITASDYDFKPHTAWGAGAVQPLTIGRHLVFVAPTRNRIRNMSNNWQNQSWDGDDISVHNPELLYPRIVDIDFVEDPNYHIVALLGDGAIAHCTYLYDQKIMAWSRTRIADVNNGTTPVKAFCVTRTSFGDVLWIVTKRIDGSVRLETITHPKYDHNFLDCAEEGTIDGSGLVTTSKFEENESLAGGNVITSMGVIRSTTQSDVETYVVMPLTFVPETVAGVLQNILPYTEGTLTLGYSFKSKAITLNQDAANPFGSSQAMKQRYYDIFLRLNNSAIPGVNGNRYPERTVEVPPDVPTPLITQDIHYNDINWGDGSMEIVQDLPIRTEILAIFGKLIGSVT